MTTLKLIKNPRITEKASFKAEENVYVFNVDKSANKNEIKKVIFQIYKVKPVKVNITKIPSKKVSLRGKKYSKKEGKKAFVYLRKEDKLEII